jgi:hypothetical protein
LNIAAVVPKFISMLFTLFSAKGQQHKNNHQGFENLNFPARVRLVDSVT